MELRANTAVDVLIGPFVEDGDGDTPATGLTLDVELSKNGQALANKNDATAPVHDAAGTVDGYYNCELDSTDTNTEGNLVLVVHHADALPVRHEYDVLSEAAWDSKYIAKDDGFMDVNIKTIGRTDTQETETNNLESACSNYSVTRGLSGTALPAAAADAGGGLPISDAGELDLDSVLSGNTPQSADNNTILAHADYGNAQLVRSTTPANSLDVSSTGEAGLDFANIKDATGAHTLINITVPNVTTTTTNTDMVGTAGANTTVPDAAGTAAALHVTTDAKIDVVDDNVDDIKLAHVLVDTTIESANRNSTNCQMATGPIENDALVGCKVVLVGDAGTGYVPRTVSAYAASNNVITWTPAIAQDPIDGGRIFVIPGDTKINVTADAILLDTETTIPGTITTLQTAVDAVPTAAETVNEWESQSQADPTGFHVNLLEVNGTAQTANDNGADINTLITQVGTAGDGLTNINLPNQTMDITGNITGNISGSVGSLTGHTVQTGDSYADLEDGGRLDLLIDAIKAKTDILPVRPKKNIAFSNFPFLMVDSTDGYTPETGLTVTCQIKSDAGTFGACSNSATESGSGYYRINLTQAEMNADVITLKFTAAGARQRGYTIVTDS